MFHSVRVKLTAWYLLIIMLVSLLFSAVLYRAGAVELEHFDRALQIRLQHEIQERSYLPPEVQAQLPPVPMYDPTALQAAKEHLLLTLAIINGGIFVLAGALGYILAGRTLRPIKEMIDEQTRFVADASHELRTPLTALKSAIEVHLRDKTLSLSEAKALLQSNLEDVNHLQFLSDALLELAQFDHSNKQLFERVALHDVLAQAIKESQHLAGEKHIQILLDKSNEDIDANPAALRELILILIDNAIKYSPENTTIHISSKRTDHHVAIFVQDQGGGISESDVPHIFDRFYRADLSRTKTVGYGLGLAIAKKIAESHSGNISVIKTTAKGTTFRVQLPLKHA